MTVHDFLARHVAAINACDHHAIANSYELDGVVVPRPGLPLAGSDREAANRRLTDLNGTMDATLRHAYVVADLALLVVDWSVRGEQWSSPVPRRTSSAAAPTARGGT